MNSKTSPSIIGQHLFADLSEIDKQALQDLEGTTELLELALRKAGFRILNRVSQRFTEGGAGFSSVILLSESHASLHTYPEHGWLAFDLFSCGNTDPLPVLDELVKRLGARVLNQQVVARSLKQT